MNYSLQFPLQACNLVLPHCVTKGVFFAGGQVDQTLWLSAISLLSCTL